MEEFLKPMGITQYRLAKEIGVPQRRIGEIVAGTRSVTTDTGLRLSRFFDMSEGFWVGLQLDFDAAVAKDTIGKSLSKIKPWKGLGLAPGPDHQHVLPDASAAHDLVLSDSTRRRQSRK